MKEQIRELMTEALQEALSPIHQEFMEQSARLSAQRFLLEMLYANSFLDSRAGFDAFMNGLLEATREKMVRAGPMTNEDATELQARIATHLQRFQDAVRLRILQGPKQ